MTWAEQARETLWGGQEVKVINRNNGYSFTISPDNQGTYAKGFAIVKNGVARTEYIRMGRRVLLEWLESLSPPPGTPSL